MLRRPLKRQPASLSAACATGEYWTYGRCHRKPTSISGDGSGRKPRCSQRSRARLVIGLVLSGKACRSGGTLSAAAPLASTVSNSSSTVRHDVPRLASVGRGRSTAGRGAGVEYSGATCAVAVDGSTAGRGRSPAGRAISPGCGCRGIDTSGLVLRGRASVSTLDSALCHSRSLVVVASRYSTG